MSEPTREAAAQLGSADRERLRALQRTILGMPSEVRLPQVEGGRALADALRTGLPDMGDVTIGRVALELGRFVGRIAANPPEGQPMIALSNQIIGAGMNLTASEWNANA